MSTVRAGRGHLLRPTSPRFRKTKFPPREIFFPNQGHIVVNVDLVSLGYDPPDTTPDSPAGWVLTFADEFEGSSVDTSKWNIRNNTSLSYELSYLRSANVTVSGSKLSIIARKENYGGRAYTSGYIDSIGKFSQRYGLWKVRAKVNTPIGTSRGVWPAPLWLRGDSSGMEIDIIEAWGVGSGGPLNGYRTGSGTYTIHQNTNGGGAKVSGWLTDPGVDLSLAFHEYEVEWDPNFIIFRLDGVQVRKITAADAPWAFSGPDYSSPGNMRVNLQIDDAGGYYGGPDGSTVFPTAAMEIDWIRVYKRGEGGGVGSGGSGGGLGGDIGLPGDPYDPGDPAGGDPGGTPGGTPSTGGLVTQAPASSNDMVIGEVFFTGNAVVVPPAGPAPAADIQMGFSTVIDVPAPTIAGGKPFTTDYWIRPDSNMSLNVGAGGIVVIPDPDPTIPGNATPGGIAATYVWTANDLRDPAGTPYNLKTWKPHGGTGPQWKSTNEYAPKVIRAKHFGPNGKNHLFPKGVHFDATNIEHMWLDWGSALNQPFSVLITGIIHYYPKRTFGHYLLDAGKETPAGLGDGGDYSIDDTLSYRSLMLYQQSSAILATHTGADAARDGKHVRVRHNFAVRPRVFFGIFDGADSYIGSWDLTDKYFKRGTIDGGGAHRYFVMGRRQDNVSDNLGMHATIFEVRMFDSALTKAQLKAHYKQLAATWKFNKYHNS